MLKRLWDKIMKDPEQARMERYLSQAVDHAHLSMLLKVWNSKQEKGFWN